MLSLVFNNASNWRTNILLNETKESFAEKADFYSNCMCVRHEKKLIDVKRFNMKRFVKKKLKKTQPLLYHFPIIYGFNFERESGRDFSLELCEFILAFEDMISYYFYNVIILSLWYYCAVNVSTTFRRHHGISFQLFFFLS